MRGNLPSFTEDICCEGSIPAYAGEPYQSPLSMCEKAVYPRVCGGTADGMSDWQGDLRLSPRMRGNLGAVYPRVCGGT